jgi:N-methylhydantoinase A/oxoprolinase/acetone carboxylase beta subunit
METASLRIGIDIGGTFTDFVVFDPATRQIHTLQAALHAARPGGGGFSRACENPRGKPSVFSIQWTVTEH